MGKEILTRCGYRCDLCLAYKDNIEKEDRRALLKEGWYRIFGIEISLEDIYCEGCISCHHDQVKLIDSGCQVRPCVINKGYENCSQCSEFPCEILETRLVRYDDLIKNGKQISRSDRKNAVKAYENYDRLCQLREQQGPHSRMYNKLLEPTLEDMVRFIEDSEQIKMWQELLDFILEHYDFTQLTRYGGKNYGWCITFKKGTKSIMTLHPERNGFTVLFVLGKKELDQWKLIKDKISPESNIKIENTKQLHDGKWVWLSRLKPHQIKDCFQLLQVKRKIK